MIRRRYVPFAIVGAFAVCTLIAEAATRPVDAAVAVKRDLAAARSFVVRGAEDALARWAPEDVRRLRGFARSELEHAEALLERARHEDADLDAGVARAPVPVEALDRAIGDLHALEEVPAGADARARFRTLCAEIRALIDRL